MKLKMIATSFCTTSPMVSSAGYIFNSVPMVYEHSISFHHPPITTTTGYKKYSIWVASSRVIYDDARWTNDGYT